MAQDTLAELNTQFDTKKLALKSILGKGHEMTQEDVNAAGPLKTELDNLQNRIAEYQKVGAMKSDLEGYESFQRDPVRTVPFGSSGGSAPGNDGFALMGSVEGGNSYFETRNGVKECVYEDGPGIFTEKAWKAITNPEYKTAFRQILRYGGDHRKMTAKAMKLLEEGLDDQAGYTVPIDSLVNRVIERKPTPTRIRGMVQSYNTSREVVEMLKLNYKADNIYTTGFRVTKTGENPGSAAAAQVTDSNLFGTIKIPVHTFMIRGLLTKNQIEDSALNLEDWVSAKFGQTIDILYDDKIFNGTNKMEPAGLLQSIASAGAGQGTDDPKISYIATGDAALITPDSLINVAMDLPEQYEDACKYYMNKVSTFKAIRGLKDLNDRYLFGAGYQDSGLATPYRPTDLLGYPYVFSGLMPNVAANAYPVLFGDMQGYQFINRLGFSVQILREVYAEFNQIALVGRVRFGGQVVEPWRLRALKVSVS